MLIITPKAEQRLSLNAPATIEVLQVIGDAVRLAVDSPRVVFEQRIAREERDGPASDKN